MNRSLSINRSVKLIYLCLLVILTPACTSHKTSHSKADITYDSKALPVIILGGGIAGLTSALYCSQANIPCLVIEGPKPGGALSQSHSVRNWPGVIDLPGADIVGALKKQVTAAGITIVQEKVTSVDLSHRPFTVTTSATAQSDRYETRTANACVIAMGTEPNFLNIPGERGADGYWGRGITNCAVCEGSLCKGKKVAIVGGGDAAMVEAGYLADIAAHVTIFVRGKHLRAKDEKTKDRTLGKPNVSIMYETQVTRAEGDKDHL
ncbi:MAG: FAD-dependent oxidoreductase, partial [Candidatus Babeliales bacterium]